MLAREWRTNVISTKLTDDLLAQAAANDAQAQLRLGLIMLCLNKVGFARVCLDDAARNGSKKAQYYLAMLRHNELSIADWRQQVINEEAQLILLTRAIKPQPIKLSCKLPEPQLQ